MSDRKFRGTHWSKMPNSQAIREKIAATKKARPTRAWLGKKHTLEERMKISVTKKNSKTTIRGEKHHNWKGGVVKQHNKIRGSLEYILWRNEVYKRDCWTCRICSKKCQTGNIVAHHLKKFADFPELRFVVENGMTLCRPCHRQTDSWGKTYGNS